jgi:hypothetical protein
MSKKYHNFASGWLKEGKNGQYISAKAGDYKKDVELYVKVDGQEMKVENFAVYFQEKNEKFPKAPDVRFTFTTEE